MFELLSFVWYLLFRIDPGQWLVAVVMAWWGLIKWGHGDTQWAHAWWMLAAILVLLSLVGRACNYVVFLPNDQAWRSLGEPPANMQVLAAGDFLRSIEGTLGLAVPRTYVKEPVVLRQRRGRPPALAALGPPRYVLAGDVPAYSSTWYPGSTVRRGTAYMGGKAYAGLELSFVGRRLILGIENEEDAAAVAAALETLETGRAPQ